MEEMKKGYTIALGPSQLALIILSALAVGGGGSGIVASHVFSNQNPVVVNIDATLEHRLTVIEQKIDILDGTVRDKLKSK
jgi:hypothetical protein